MLSLATRVTSRMMLSVHASAEAAPEGDGPHPPVRRLSDLKRFETLPAPPEEQPAEPAPEQSAPPSEGEAAGPLDAAPAPAAEEEPPPPPPPDPEEVAAAYAAQAAAAMEAKESAEKAAKAAQHEAAAAAARAALTEATAAELATKVSRLREMLAEQTKVGDEGARLQRAVQRQEEEDSLKMVDLLRAADEAFSAEIASAKAATEEQTVLRMREIAEEELAGAQAAHQAALEEASAAMEASMEVAREEIANKLQAGYDTALLTEREEQTNKLGAIDVEVGALAGVLFQDTRYKEVSHATHQLSACVLSARAKPTSVALSTLPALAERVADELLVEALSPLADKGAADRYAKTPTFLELAKRFDDVASAGRVAALVPENASGMWGHALAAVTSALTSKAVEGTTEASKALALAEGALERGDLKGAVAEVRKLEGPPAATAKGWLAAAEDRLMLDQMLTVATAASTIATAGLAPF